MGLRRTSLAGATVLVAGSMLLAAGGASASENSGFAAARTPPAGTQLAKIANPNPTQDGYFGYSVGVSGARVVIGSTTGNGEAYVYTGGGSTWTGTARFVGSSPTSDFGEAVAISGNTIVVGDQRYDNSAGRAFVYQFESGHWIRTATLKGSNTVANNEFGEAVAISGNSIVVGAPFYGNVGRAYVFSFSGGRWKQAAILAGAVNYNDEFGQSVAISGGAVVVGDSVWDHSHGHAYVFRIVKGKWTEAADLEGPNSVEYDHFGLTVAISGTTVAVAAPDHANESGLVYVFQDVAGKWHFVTDFKASNTVDDDFFGETLALSGSLMVVGAEGSGSHGLAYLFSDASGRWREVKQLEPTDLETGDRFGFSVGVSGSVVAVGSSTPSVNGRSAVYIFQG